MPLRSITVALVLGLALLLAALVLALGGSAAARTTPGPASTTHVAPGSSAETRLPGATPNPILLARPPDRPLSAVARLGRDIFFDSTLSASGRLSCASCHSPAHAYGPPDARSVRLGGPALGDQGVRAVPSLRYIGRVPRFGIGPDLGDVADENIARSAARSAVRLAAATRAGPAPRKVAGAAAAAPVPHGGLFWDGRAATLQTQAMVPLLNPVEMANDDVASVAAKLRAAPYASRFAELFGAPTLSANSHLVGEAMFAVARFELEDPSFHPYSSKYDAYLEGKATLSPAELRGLRIFEDPAKGNCAACHISRPGPDHRPPTFTDYEYEALGVPRNDSLAGNRDPRHFDLGLCGPVRTDLRVARYCGLFRTPSLRNVATRHVFFHNGVYHSLQQVLEFYDFRDTRPGRIYPRLSDGSIAKFDDLPAPYRVNIDTIDAPFDRHAGQAPVLSSRDIRDLIAFLKTLTDGYEGQGR